MKRLFIVYNPRSSKHARVKTEILDRLSTLKGYVIGKYLVERTNVDRNAAKFAKILKDGDFVISVGGDATASIAANGIMLSKKDVCFAVLPYGNFNDLARTLGTMKFEDVLGLLSCERVTAMEGVPQKCRHFWGRKMAGRTRAIITKLYPLEIIVDGKHWRFATCYVTIGMTAESVELFDEPAIRKKLQKARQSSWRSYFYLAKWYFKNRHKKQFLPDFKLNGHLQPPKTSDYFAVNGRFICHVMKGGSDYLSSTVFRCAAGRLTSFWRLFKFMAKSILARTPGTETKGDVLEFLVPATVCLQAEGECHTFKNVKRIEIRKSDRCLNAIMLYC